jgi:subtilisin family serine protease
MKPVAVSCRDGRAAPGRPVGRPAAFRLLLLAGAGLPLAACGGAGGSGPAPLSSTPAAVTPAPTPPATPTPTINYDTAEYRRSGAAVQSGAITAWQAGATGSGVTIGFIDSGINAASPEFAGRIAAASRDVSGQGRDIQDVSGHGTAVAGVAAAARNDSQIMGVAFAATLAVFRADNGQCSDGCNYTDNAIAAGLDAAVGAGARVVNISLGGSSATTGLRNAFNRAVNAGTVLVISAGNDGAVQPDPLPVAALNSTGSPNIIIAGSIDSSGAISSFSNRAGAAQSNFLVAVGEGVRSFDQTGQAFLYSGTSFAAPTVSGAVALLAQAFPNLTGARIVEILFTTADDLGAPGTDAVFGRGRLNITRAMSPIGQTSLAGTAVAVSPLPSGSLGSAMGNGLSTGAGLRTVPVTDAFDRAYSFALGATMRPAYAGRLAGRLESSRLETTETRLADGLVSGRLSLRATPFRERMAADSFRDADTPEAHLGLAQRGTDYRAAGRNPLRETRLSLQAGAGGLTFASGRLAGEALPGAARGGFVADDGLAPDEGTGTTGRQLVLADVSRGGLTMAFGAESRRIPLPRTLGLSGTARQDRLLVAAAWASGPLELSVQAADVQDMGALLGTRLDPSFGLEGGRTQTLGGAATLGRGAYSLRLAGTQGWVTPTTSGGGLLRADGALRTQGWSATATLPMGPGLVSVRLAQPLAVTAGQFRLANGTPVGAAVTAQEQVVEVGLDIGLFGAPLSLAAFERRNAGNLAGLADRGAAFTWRVGF